MSPRRRAANPAIRRCCSTASISIAEALDAGVSARGACSPTDARVARRRAARGPRASRVFDGTARGPRCRQPRAHRQRRRRASPRGSPPPLDAMLLDGATPRSVIGARRRAGSRQRRQRDSQRRRARRRRRGRARRHGRSRRLEGAARRDGQHLPRARSRAAASTTPRWRRRARPGSRDRGRRAAGGRSLADLSTSRRRRSCCSATRAPACRPTSCDQADAAVRDSRCAPASNSLNVARHGGAHRCTKRDGSATARATLDDRLALRDRRRRRPLPGTPLAERMRPRTLDEFVGQAASARAGPAAAAGARTRRAALADPLGPARHRQDDAGAAAGVGRGRRLRRVQRGHVRHQGNPARSSPPPSARARNAAGGRCSSSTKSIASTRRSRTRSCRTSKPARSSSSARRRRIRRSK